MCVLLTQATVAANMSQQKVFTFGVKSVLNRNTVTTDNTNKW